MSSVLRYRNTAGKVRLVSTRIWLLRSMLFQMPTTKPETRDHYPRLHQMARIGGTRICRLTILISCPMPMVVLLPRLYASSRDALYAQRVVTNRCPKLQHTFHGSLEKRSFQLSHLSLPGPMVTMRLRKWTNMTTANQHNDTDIQACSRDTVTSVVHTAATFEGCSLVPDTAM